MMAGKKEFLVIMMRVMDGREGEERKVESTNPEAIGNTSNG